MPLPPRSWLVLALFALLLAPRMGTGEPRPLTPGDVRDAHIATVCAVVGNMAVHIADMRDRGLFSLNELLPMLGPPPDTPPGSAAPFVASMSRAVAVVLYRDPTITGDAARKYGETECRRLYPKPPRAPAKAR